MPAGRSAEDIVADACGGLHSDHLCSNSDHDRVEEQAMEDRKDSHEAKMLEAYFGLSHTAAPTCKDVADNVISLHGGDDPGIAKYMKPKYVSRTMRIWDVKHIGRTGV